MQSHCLHCFLFKCKVRSAEWLWRERTSADPWKQISLELNEFNIIYSPKYVLAAAVWKQRVKPPPSKLTSGSRQKHQRFRFKPVDSHQKPEGRRPLRNTTQKTANWHLTGVLLWIYCNIKPCLIMWPGGDRWNLHPTWKKISGCVVGGWRQPSYVTWPPLSNHLSFWSKHWHPRRVTFDLWVQVYSCRDSSVRCCMLCSASAEVVVRDWGCRSIFFLWLTQEKMHDGVVWWCRSGWISQSLW